MKRLFLAISIPPSEELLQLHHALKRQMSMHRISWIEPSNLHSTLKFFGETSEREIPQITSAVKEAINGLSGFELQYDKLGIFGSAYAPRIIWLGFQEDQQLMALYKKLKRYLEAAGFLYDRQNFVPHITLARIRSITKKQLFQKTLVDYQPASLGKVEVGELILYESILRSEEPVYVPIERFTI